MSIKNDEDATENRMHALFLKNLRTHSELRQRIIVSAGIVTLLIVIFALIATPFFKFIFASIVFLVACAAMKEYFHFVSLKNVIIAERTAFFCTILYLSALLFFPNDLSVQHQTLMSCVFIVLFSYCTSQKSPILGSATTLFALMYIAFPICCLYEIVYLLPASGSAQGRLLLIYLLATTKSVDLGGYFVGKRFGSILLAKSLSPKKTVEGAIGGTIAAIGMSLIFYKIDSFFFFNQYLQLSFPFAILWGAIFALFAQFGDLAESLLKRDVGVKDSNHLPGLGGLLDMLDSLLFTIPVMRYFWFQ